MAVVNLADSFRFASLSGDFNPLHVSPLDARRTLFGQPIVHGMFVVCAALDQVMTQRASRAQLAKLRAIFHRSVPLNSDFEIAFDNGSNGEIAAFVKTSSGEPAATVRVRLSDRFDKFGNPLDSTWPHEEPTAQDGTPSLHAGHIDLRLHREIAASLFPAALDYLPHQQLAVLLATTRVVGMRVPGLHSIFSSLNISFQGQQAENRVDYSVKHTRADLGLIALEFTSEGVRGAAETFERPRPAVQPSVADVMSNVSGMSLRGRTALVVGGNRGIGEVAAKLLAVAGADVTIGFHLGEMDAQRVVSELAVARIDAHVAAIDVTRSFAELQRLHASLLERQHFVVFCATPPIHQSGTTFDRTQFNKYCDYYVEGMEKIARIAGGGQLRRLVAPSTEFLDTNDHRFCEYVAAKAAAEALALALNNSPSKPIFSMPRLKRVLTDQTNGVTAGSYDNIIEEANTLIKPIWCNPQIA